MACLQMFTAEKWLQLSDPNYQCKRKFKITCCAFCKGLSWADGLRKIGLLAFRKPKFYPDL